MEQTNKKQMKPVGTRVNTLYDGRLFLSPISKWNGQSVVVSTSFIVEDAFFCMAPFGNLYNAFWARHYLSDDTVAGYLPVQ